MTEMLDLAELREAVRGVLGDRGGDVMDIPGEEGRGFDRALWDEMAGLGWLGLAVAEAQGGLGQGAAHLGVLYEELGRELASVPILATMLAAGAIERHGDDEAKARWLPAIASGECRAAVALPGEGDVATLGADGRVTGTLDHLAFGDVATLIAVPVRSGGATALALALFVADGTGVAVTPRPAVDLTRSLARVAFDHAVPEAMLAIDAAGWDALADHAAMGLACDAVGAITALLERTVDYLQIREQFGRPIGSFQALKHRTADWKVKIEAATALVRQVAALLAGGEPASAIASEAKAYACDTFAAFAGDAVQLHGGIGFTWEHPCHLFLKRGKLSQQLHGSSTAHKERAARFAFGQRDRAAAPGPWLAAV